VLRSAFRSAFDFKGVRAGIGSPFLGQHRTPFVGALDDFQVTNRALSEDQILARWAAVE
jgi:hypothetical protein